MRLILLCDLAGVFPRDTADGALQAQKLLPRNSLHVNTTFRTLSSVKAKSRTSPESHPVTAQGPDRNSGTQASRGCERQAQGGKRFFCCALLGCGRVGQGRGSHAAPGPQFVRAPVFSPPAAAGTPLRKEMLGLTASLEGARGAGRPVGAAHAYTCTQGGRAQDLLAGPPAQTLVPPVPRPPAPRRSPKPTNSASAFMMGSHTCVQGTRIPGTRGS